MQLLYKDVSVSVNFGGGLTNRISFQKGVRQGDPMASSLYILCLEPCLRRLARKMRAIAPSPFLAAPETNLSAYADDTIPFLSDTRQLSIIESELSEYGRFSGGRVKDSKCELVLLGSWKSMSIQTKYMLVSGGSNILGLYFGELTDLNWSTLLTKFRSKLEIYRRSSASSPFSRARVLNLFVLPILWYALKIFDPPANFYKEVEALCVSYVWEGSRNWVAKPFVFAPCEGGGPGVRSPRPQTLVFRLRALFKGMSCGEYFLSKMGTNSKLILYGGRESVITFI